jgi:hypothetical protein
MEKQYTKIELARAKVSGKKKKKRGLHDHDGRRKIESVY